MTRLDLMRHQERAVERARRQPRYLLGFDPGTGKTIATLAIIAGRPEVPTLVVCPVSVMRDAWEDDARHFTGLRVTIHHGAKAKRVEALRRAWLNDRRSGCVVVTSFETFRQDFEILVAFGFGRLVVDESSRAKNPKAKTTDRVIRFADRMTEVYELSGTPAPNGPEEYWPQLRILDPRAGGLADRPYAEKGSPSFWRWAGYWLDQHTRTLGSGGDARRITEGWTVKGERREQFRDMLSQAIMRVRAEDVLELPPMHEVDVAVDPSPAEERATRAVLEDLAVHSEDGERFEVAASAAAMKLRQIVGGNVRAGTDWQDVGQSKLDALADLVEPLASEPFIVWTQFRREADRVVELLEKLGREVGRCDGESPDVAGAVRGFKAGELDSLVCHPRSVGHGVTLVRSGDRPCRYAIYFGLGYSYEEHEQSMKRIHRHGQGERCTYYYLLARGSIDHVMRAAVRRKERASRAVIDSLRERVAERQGKEAGRAAG